MLLAREGEPVTPRNPDVGSDVPCEEREEIEFLREDVRNCGVRGLEGASLGKDEIDFDWDRLVLCDEPE